MANPSELKVGQKVIWLHETRGGYGYIWRIPATVVRIGKSRVTIEVTRRDGSKVLRSVLPEKLT